MHGKQHHFETDSVDLEHTAQIVPADCKSPLLTLLLPIDNRQRGLDILSAVGSSLVQCSHATWIHRFDPSSLSGVTYADDWTSKTHHALTDFLSLLSCTFNTVSVQSTPERCTEVNGEGEGMMKAVRE